jgi:hypothetical protein
MLKSGYTKDDDSVKGTYSSPSSCVVDGVDTLSIANSSSLTIVNLNPFKIHSPF